MNIRSTPKVTKSNRLAVLPEGQNVNKLHEKHSPWWYIHTILTGYKLEGYVHSKYLVKEEGFIEPLRASSITAVHLKENNTLVTRDRDGGRAHPLGEPNRPRRTANSTKKKIEQIGKIINWINVDNSIRYLCKGQTTYCNIYAYDFCYLSGAYIPRVWWKQKSIIELDKGNEVPVLFGNTVVELSANSLHDWLYDFGTDFGWVRTFSIDKAQSAANNGKIVIVCAKRVTTNRPGHM